MPGPLPRAGEAGAMAVSRTPGRLKKAETSAALPVVAGYKCGLASARAPSY